MWWGTEDAEIKFFSAEKKSEKKLTAKFLKKDQNTPRVKTMCVFSPSQLQIFVHLIFTVQNVFIVIPFYPS